MAKLESKDTIGTVLGAHLALFEEDLTNDPDDMEVMEKIRVISEAYRNFAIGGLKQFRTDFEQGYELGKRDVSFNRDAKPENQIDPRRDFDKG